MMGRAQRLRGSKLDFFGHTAHRQRERELIGEYELVVDELMGALSVENHELAVEIAQIPEQIRGFGSVKDEHLVVAKAAEAILLERFRTPEAASVGTVAGTDA